MADVVGTTQLWDAAAVFDGSFVNQAAWRVQVDTNNTVIDSFRVNCNGTIKGFANSKRKNGLHAYGIVLRDSTDQRLWVDGVLADTQAITAVITGQAQCLPTIWAPPSSIGSSVEVTWVFAGDWSAAMPALAENPYFFIRSTRRPISVSLPSVVTGWGPRLGGQRNRHVVAA